MVIFPEQHTVSVTLSRRWIQMKKCTVSCFVVVGWLARVRREPPLPLLLSELSCLVVSRFGMSSCFRSLSRAAPGTSHSRSASKAGPDLPNRQQPIHKTIWPCGPASTSSVHHGIKQAIKWSSNASRYGHCCPRPVQLCWPNFRCSVSVQNQESLFH